MKIPPDVRLVPELPPPPGHRLILELLLSSLPRAVIGEAIAAELPPNTSFTLEVETGQRFPDPGPDPVRLNFTFGSRLVDLRGRVIHVGDDFRLMVEPSYSFPHPRD